MAPKAASSRPAAMPKTKSCIPPDSNAKGVQDGPQPAKRKQITAEVEPQHGIVSAAHPPTSDVTLPPSFVLPDAATSLPTLDDLATASHTMSSHAIIRVMLDKVRARLSKAIEGDIASQPPLEIGRTNGFCAHWVGPTAYTALKSTGKWHGAINLFWLDLLHGYSMVPYWRNIVQAFQHFYAAGAREVPVTVRCIISPPEWEHWGTMKENDRILTPFGLKIFGGHELLWGWLLGAFHASDQDLPAWANAACSTIVEFHSNDGPNAALKDMQADEDTAQIAHLMKSDALKTKRKGLQVC